jgi:hypothetical protein
MRAATASRACARRERSPVSRAAATVCASSREENAMVTHMVLLRIRKDVPQTKVDEVLGELAGLRGKVPGIVGFSCGKYSSPEGLHRGFTHGFCMTFADAAARDAYLPHPEHEKVKQSVLAVLDGGLDGVIAFDYVS